MTAGLGLGFERLGLVVLTRPRPATALVLLVSLVLIALLPGLRFDGDILKRLDRDTAAWHGFAALEREFAAPAPDIHLLIGPPPEGTEVQTWLNRQQDLALDLRLDPDIAGVQSLFALRRVAEEDGTAPLFDPGALPETWGALDQTAEAHPEMALFLAPDARLARMSVTFTPEARADSTSEARAVAAIGGLAETSGLQVQLAGRAAVLAETSATLLSDLILMISLSVIGGWTVGFLVFSDIRPVIVVNLASLTAMVWTAGFAVLIGQPLDSFTVILPILASVIAFADAVHIVVPLQARIARGTPPAAAIREIIGEVGPATAMTSMTTAVAFGSLAVAGSGMVDVARLGVAAVVLAWLSVMTLCPLLCLVLARRGLGTTRFHAPVVRHAFTTIAARTIGWKGAVSVGVLGAVVVLVWATARVPSDHLPEDYLAAQSPARAAETVLEQHFNGSLSTLVAMPLAVPGDPSAPQNRERLQSWHAALEAMDAGAVWSRARLAPELAERLPADAPDVSRQGDRMLLAVSHSWSETGAETLRREQAMREVLAPLPGGNEARVTGLASVAAQITIGDIDRLRGGIFLSVALAAGLVALLSRDPAAGFALGLAVLLSVLLVLALGAALRGVVSYGLTVALIISVGIAIDDGIHLANMARRAAPRGPIPARAWSAAVAQTGVAILISSLILIATLSVTQLASMPGVRGIGRDIMLALAIALVLTLTVIGPLALVAGRRLGQRAEAPR